MPGIGEKAVKFVSKAGNWELFVLDNNAIFDLQYTGPGTTSGAATLKAYEAALIVLVKTALTRTAKK